MINFVNYNVGMSPYKQAKCIDPITTAAAIKGVASLAGSIFGSSSASKAAKMQLQATRETNEANAKLAAQQNEWNIQQWQRQNEYNTPLAQRQRYEEAGINPYFAMGNITSGNAESLSSADLANQVPETSPLQGVSGQILGQGISDAVNNGVDSYYNFQMANEQIKSQQIQNTFDLLSMRDKINSLHYDSESKRMANYVFNANMEDMIQQTHQQTLQSYSQTALMALNQVGSEWDVGMKSFQARFLQPQAYAIGNKTLGQMAAQIAYTKAQENWTKKQTQLATKYAAAAWMTAYGSLLSGKASWKNAQTNEYDVKNQVWNRNQATYRENYVFNRAKDALVQQIKSGVDLLDQQVLNSFEDYTRKHAENYFDFNTPVGKGAWMFNRWNPVKFGFGF